MIRNGIFIASLREIVGVGEGFDFQVNPVNCLFVNPEYEFDWRHSFVDIFSYRIPHPGNPLRINHVSLHIDDEKYLVNGDPIPILWEMKVNRYYGVTLIQGVIFVQREAKEDCIPMGYFCNISVAKGDLIHWSYIVKTP